MTAKAELKKLQKRHDKLANEMRGILEQIDTKDAMLLLERAQAILARKKKILSLIWTGKE